MPLPRKLLALTTGAILALSASFLSPTHAQQPGGRDQAETIQIPDATVEFINKSDVSALTEGVLEKLELKVGTVVKQFGVIGSLHKKKAELIVRKAKTAASSEGAIKKAEAQKEQAVAVVARNERLRKTNKTYVSQEDYDKAIADLLVTEAMIQEAKESRMLAEDELHLAQQALDEHTIKSPFDGTVLNILKKPGESVKANEPVVEIGSLDRLRVFAKLSLEESFRISEGSPVEWQLTVHGKQGGTLPLEEVRFRGVVSSVSTVVKQADAKSRNAKAPEVEMYADFVNNANKDMRPGMKGTLTLFLGPVGARPARGGVTTNAPPTVPAQSTIPAEPTTATLPKLPD